MKIGDRVRVTGLAGSVIAIVQEIRTPGQLPQFHYGWKRARFPAPAPAAETIAAILRDLDIDQVAILSYPYGAPDNELLFLAAHVAGPEPGWRDLRGQLLTIEIL